MSEEGDVQVTESDFYIPKDALGDKKCKPGDTITLTVSQVDDEGDVGVKMSGYSHKDGEKTEDSEEAELRLAFK